MCWLGSKSDGAAGPSNGGVDWGKSEDSKKSRDEQARPAMVSPDSSPRNSYP